MTVAICDDEINIIKEVKRLLISLNDKLEITIFTEAEKLIAKNSEYDIVFLDIDMPSISGIKVAEHMHENKLSNYIIFLTSHAEFMQDAFKVRAFRYLNKPVNIDDLKNVLYDIEKENFEQRKVLIKTQKQVIWVNVNDIICIEAFGDGTYVHTKEKVYVCSKKLKDWQTELGTEHFFQTHKSFIIALKFVNKINENDVEMNYISINIPISRRKNTLFKSVFLEYVKNNSVAL